MSNKIFKLRIVFAFIVFGNMIVTVISIILAFNLFNPTTGNIINILPFGFRGFITVMALVIGFFIERIINKKVLQPITKLNEAMKQIASGSFRQRLAQNSKISEVRGMVDSFNHMANELSNIEMFRQDFVGNVSHEFKTPLAAIEGYATLLQNDDLTAEEKKDYATRIVSSTKRLSTLSDNILKISRLENQESYLEKGCFNLTEQIRTAILTLENNWNSKKMNLDIDLEEINYEGNEDLLFQVWINLLENAIKFTNTGGSIGVKLWQKENKIHVKITDTGVGIPPEIRKRIFEKFYQGDNSHNTEGNGLGLALVWRIINLHDGFIDVESMKGQGSTFTVILKNEG
jgi:Signal transduction histidine kinase